MRSTAKFQKISLNNYLAFGSEQTYESIRLPQRATEKSAGYDFFAPEGFVLKPNETLTVPTGIRAIMPSDLCLLIFPRSGLGFKYKLRLNNTVGVIDADYFESDNEGHIFIRMTNESDKTLEVKKGEAFAQGILMPYYTTEDDDVTVKRNGGLGSTTKH